MTLLCPTCGHPLADHFDATAIAAAIPMGALERRIFDRLNQRFGAWVDSPTLTDAVYWDDPEGGPESAENSVSVTVHHLRKKLQAYGLTIEGHSARFSRGRRLAWVELPAAAK